MEGFCICSVFSMIYIGKISYGKKSPRMYELRQITVAAYISASRFMALISKQWLLIV